MARRKRNSIIACVLACVVLIVSSIFTFGLFNAPSWKEIFSLSGITDVNREASKYDLQVNFLDVGKADSIFIRYKNKNILIDAGNYDIENTVVEYLKQQDVKSLDMLINTHPDKDHLGQMANVVYEFDVKEFVYAPVPDELVPTSMEYQTLWFALGEKNVPTVQVKGGDDLSFDDVSLKVIAPISQNKDSTNDNSIVLKLTYKDDTFLFMGDAEEDEEDEILDSGVNIKADLIKIAHHGSKTSTSKALLKAVLPEFAVISTGEDKNNLPNQTVLDRLSEKNIEIYRTDLDGNITAVSSGDGIKIFTQK